MAREQHSRTKALILVVVILVVIAIAAYFLHLRPAEEVVTQPEELREDAQGPPARQ